MRNPWNNSKVVLLFILIVVISFQAKGQQFNSDNYLSKPHGVATLILTYGQRNSMLMNTFSLKGNKNLHVLVRIIIYKYY